MAVEQLVLPKQCRETVLMLAHTIPLAGHLGRDKTTKWVLQHVYWPIVHCDVATLVVVVVRMGCTCNIQYSSNRSWDVNLLSWSVSTS